MLFYAAVLEEKAAAIHALGVYASECPHAFGPFIETSLDLALKMVEYFHEIVRDEAYTTLSHILKAALHHYPHTADGSPHPFKGEKGRCRAY